MIFYLTNVTIAVNLSQPSVCIGGGLHAPSFRTALSKPRNLSYFPLKIRSRPKKGEKRPRLRTERFDSWVSKIARLREDTTQKATRNFCPQRYQPSRVTTLQKHRHPGSLIHIFFLHGGSKSPKPMCDLKKFSERPNRGLGSG